MLRPFEGICIDGDQLLAVRSGCDGLDGAQLVEQALSALSERISDLCWPGVPCNAASAAMARKVASLSSELGLSSIARVAAMVADAATGGDRVAFAATRARLDRVAARSYDELWQLARG